MRSQPSSGSCRGSAPAAPDHHTSIGTSIGSHNRHYNMHYNMHQSSFGSFSLAPSLALCLGVTWDERVTVPLMAMSCPIFVHLKSRSLHGSHQVKDLPPAVHRQHSQEHSQQQETGRDRRRRSVRGGGGEIIEADEEELVAGLRLVRVGRRVFVSCGTCGPGSQKRTHTHAHHTRQLHPFPRTPM